jgi:hypothetical protein
MVKLAVTVALVAGILIQSARAAAAPAFLNRRKRYIIHARAVFDFYSVPFADCFIQRAYRVCKLAFLLHANKDVTITRNHAMR